MVNLLGTICGCSTILNFLSESDSHGLALYCYVTIIRSLLCFAMYTIASVPR